VFQSLDTLFRTTPCSYVPKPLKRNGTVEARHPLEAALKHISLQFKSSINDKRIQEIWHKQGNSNQHRLAKNSIPHAKHGNQTALDKKHMGFFIFIASSQRQG
jgi:hypothetical protein